MEFFLLVLGGASDYAKHIAFACIACMTLELIAPANHCGWRSRVRGAGFWLVYIAITATFFTWFNAFLTSFGFRPLLTLDFGWLAKNSPIALRVVAYLAAAVLAGIVADFFYYWFHRLQHNSAVLWRFHAVHHSLREMSALNSNHHFTEEIFRIPFVAIPLALLVHADSGYVPAAILVVLRMQGIFAHSCTTCHLGPFRYIVADNRYHRIHHSVEIHHRNRNFGSFSSVWDVLFGTAHMPTAGEWPKVGLDYVDEPRSLAEFLWRPMRRSMPMLPKVTRSGR